MSVRSSRQHLLHPTAAAIPAAMPTISCLDFISSTHHFADRASPTLGRAVREYYRFRHYENNHRLVIWRVDVKYSANGIGVRRPDPPNEQFS
jgi:hypothetical protein